MQNLRNVGVYGGNGVLIYILGDQEWPSDKVTLEKELVLKPWSPDS